MAAVEIRGLYKRFGSVLGGETSQPGGRLLALLSPKSERLSHISWSRRVTWVTNANDPI